MNNNSIPRATQDAPQKPAEGHLNRACEACRLLKVRCLPDSSSTAAICQRCKRSGRICIYAAPQKRRQRIRTDTRVAELEREIRAMRALLTGGDEPIAENKRGEKDTTVVTVPQDLGSTTEADTSTTASCGEERSSIDGKDRSWQSSVSTSNSATPDDGMSPEGTHPSKTEAGPKIEFASLSPEIMNQLFESYKYDLVQHYPAVIFPDTATADEVRKSKPVLFQAVVTSASCQLDPIIYRELFKEMTKIYAEKIFINGEKSLELIQSLMLTSIWYCPPDESCGRTNLHFYQYIHMAATMALDLGIGLIVDKSTISLDECRSLLICYLNCAGIAMRMRRPNMLQWSSGMSDCLEVLENSPDATLLDQRLAAWVRLQNIADEWSKSVGSINSQVELSLKGFQRQLQKWKDAAGPGVINISLALAYHQDSIYLHESALEGGSTTLVDFNHRHFMPASNARVRDEQEAAQLPLTAGYVNAVMAVIDSSHSLLDEFLQTDLQALRVVPIVHYVRASYALVVLVKLFISASVPSNELGKILDPQLLKIDFYMNIVLDRIAEAAGPAKLIVPLKWFTIIQQVSEWYNKSKLGFGHLQKPNHKGSEAPQAARSTNGSADGSATFQHSNGSDIQNLWKVDPFPTIASLKEHASLQMGSDEINLEFHQDVGTLQQSIGWSNMSNGVTASDEHVDFASFTNDASSPPMENFAPMDFAQDDLSFLDIPGIPPGAFNSWMPNESMQTDMNNEHGANSWAFDFN